MQLYRYDTSRDGTHKQTGGRSVDAALLVEELVGIYSTPTPKGWREAEKVIVLIDCVISFTITGDIYTRNLNMNPTQIRLITILGTKENIPNLKRTWTLIFSFL